MQNYVKSLYVLEHIFKQTQQQTYFWTKDIVVFIAVKPFTAVEKWSAILCLGHKQPLLLKERGKKKVWVEKKFVLVFGKIATKELNIQQQKE